MVRTTTRQACAKINLGLDVVGVREDGYHLLRMIMQQIDLHDTLEVTAYIPDDADAAGGRAQDSAEGTGAGGGESAGRTNHIESETAKRDKRRSYLEEGQIVLLDESGLSPAGEENLICRAVRMMEKAYGLRAGFEIRLTKRIPVAAGLAGGSTDAAAAFLAVRDLLVPDATDEDLMGMAVRLGADIPYCIAGGTKLAEGIGERLTKLPPMPDCAIVLVKPEASASTAQVYRELDSLGVSRHPDIDGQIAALREGDLEGLVRRCGNVLEPVTGREHPVIGRIEEFFIGQGALAAMMSGSGPTVFAVFKTVQEAETARRAFLDTEMAAGCSTFCARPVSAL